MINIFRKIIWRLDYSGERVVLPEMRDDTNTLIRHLSRYVFALNYSSNKSILDVACGTGYGTALLSSIAKKIIGIDIHKNSILFAKKNNIYYCPVKFIITDIENTKIQGIFDSIISFETIEHLKNPQLFLNKIKKNVIKKGFFIFSVPINDFPNKYHLHKYNWCSLSLLIKSSLGGKITWYSQTENNIYNGKKSSAQFALGVWKKL